MSVAPIFPGRLQPPHNDHLALIRRVLADHGRLIVALLVAAPETTPPRDAFDAEARLHHAGDRCPFTYLERKRMLEAALHPRERSRVDILAIPRPEQSWPWVSTLLAPPRAWIVPDSGEHLDDLKAAFFADKGDRVLRVPQPATTDGRLVRALIAARDPRLPEHVPPGVAELIAAWRKHG